MIVICEDEMYFASQLKDIINQYLHQKQYNATILFYANGEDLLYSGISPDIILMDIKLPGKNGMNIMNIMKRLQENGYNSQVIFITAYQEYVFEAFDIDAIHYLEKPLNQQKFFAAMEKAWKRAVSDNAKTILLNNRAVITKVRLKDIVYCEVFNHQVNHQVIIHTMTEQHQYFGTLDTLEKELDNHFFRCHRSYIVNLDYIVDKKPGIAVLADGRQVFVSRRKQREFAMRILESCKGEN